MKTLSVLFVASIFLLACGFYQADVNQGSVLTLEQVNRITIGMRQDKVKKILGSPAIIDPFNKNSWHYIHHSTLDNNDIRYHLEVVFDQQQLVSRVNRRNSRQLRY